jgi:hypothetical protein
MKYTGLGGSAEGLLQVILHKGREKNQTNDLHVRRFPSQDRRQYIPIINYIYAVNDQILILLINMSATPVPNQLVLHVLILFSYIINSRSFLLFYYLRMG